MAGSRTSVRPRHDVPALAANLTEFGREGALARAEEAQSAYAAGRAAVEACEALPPGAELLAAVLGARQLPLDTASRITLVGCWERLRAWVDAETMSELSQAAGMPDVESDRWVAADTALVTGLSEQTVGNRFALMRRVGESLPASWEALRAGRITLLHVRALDDVLRECEPELAHRVEAAVLANGIARGWRPSQLRDAARRALLRLDPDGAEGRARRARRSRSDVRFRPAEDLLGDLVTTGDAATTRRMYDKVDLRAQALRRAGDPRPIGELRVAALAEALLEATTTGVAATDDGAAGATPGPETGPATQHRCSSRPSAHVVLSLSTLLGGDGPGELVGYGAITASMARRIAADADLTRLVCDPLTGRPTDLGRRSYRLSAQLRRWIEVRDRTCRFPGCRALAVHCDADHDEEWSSGGETSCDNCGLLCRRHHNFETSKAWDLTRHPDDTTHWRSPHGFGWWTEAAIYDVTPDATDPQWSGGWPKAG